MGPEVGGTGEFYDAAQLECDCRLTKPTTDSNSRLDYVFFATSRTPWQATATMDQLDSPAGHHLLRAVGKLYRNR